MTAFHSKGLVNVRAMRVAHALTGRPQRFADLQDNIVHHQEALARVLRKLEADQIVSKVYNGYTLTARGRSWVNATAPLLAWLDLNRIEIEADRDGRRCGNDPDLRADRVRHIEGTIKTIVS
jgi:DNA-binding HxlR family transcriptional regulator